MQALLEHFILQSALYSLIAVLLVAFGVAGAGWPDSARYRDDGGAGCADWQRRTELLACLACGHHWLPIGGLDLLLAGLAL